MIRRYIHKTAMTVAMLAATASLPQAQAQTQASYPAKPVTIVVPYQAGGSTDMLARLVGQHLQARWNKTVIVDNRPGGAGAIGARQVARSQPDGHTIMIGIAGMMMVPYLTEGDSFDLEKDFVPVTQLARTPAVLTVAPQSKATTLAEFVEQARAAPQQFSLGNWGVGSLPHLQAEQFTRQIGTPDIVHVPFPGAAPLITNIIGGQVSAAFIDFASLRPHLGSVQTLAVTGAERSAVMPDVPTMAEMGYSGFDSYGWWGVFLPLDTPDAMVNQLAQDVRDVLQLPAVTERIQAMGLQVGGNAPEAYAADIRREVELYTKVIDEIGLRPAADKSGNP